ncbi:hypothetical protein [uncultured Roseobacter sp.]|uniref:hypothetical protein n=1 Tax=uncultured Roseobacter sp. TaxID=114847 RepID=UPI0026027F69|nr:hypothetical protein [uncultured Roseobacter sp.]
MIRLAGLTSLLLIAFATMASANPIVVRSGDHNGFTRLVMRLPAGVQWQVTESRGLKTITVSDHQEGFDTSRVFDVIPRNLLTGVRDYPSRLELELSCQCELNTFVERNEFLVVDILDGPALPPLEARQASQFISAQPASRFNFGDLLWSEFDAPEDNDQRIITPDAPADYTSSPDLQTALIDQTRQQLMRGIGDATSRGILEPVTPDLQVFEQQSLSPQDQEIFDSSEQEVATAIPSTGNMRITSARDVPVSEAISDLMTSGQVCPNPSGVDLSSWGNDKPFGIQVAALRDTLYTEIDRLDPDKVKKLARVYLYFGFGAEAKQVLRLSDEVVATNPELMDLADVMDYGFARNPRFIHQFSDCDSDLALWGILAAKELPDGKVVNANAALRALAKLPYHLKEFLAPALSSRFSEQGDLESASIALRNIELSGDAPQPDAGIAKAKIARKTGNSEKADELLKDVIEGNAIETPEALIAFVENRLAEEEDIPADIALLIETYAFERRNDPIAQSLIRAHVIASSYSMQFSKAFEALADPIIASDDALIAELLSHTFIALSERADDITFLESFYTKFPASPGAMIPRSIQKTAKRLLTLGFAEEANRILSEIREDNQSREVKLVHAEVLLMLGSPELAVPILEDVEGEQVDKLRAKALLALGDNQSALELFQATNTPDEALRSAWLANNWADLMPQDTPLLSAVSSLAKQPVEYIETEDGMIASSSVAVEQSTTARETLEAMLEQFPVSP